MDEKEQAAEQEYREQLTEELWGDGEPASDEAPEVEVRDEAPEADPWQGVPAALRQSIEAMQAKLGAVDTIGQEMKMWSGRVGALQRELQMQKNQASEAAKLVREAPSKEQMAEAAQDDETWKELREEFPEWADALDSRTSKLRDELMGQINTLRQQPQAVDLDGLRKEYEVKLLTLAHKDWRETVNSPEYSAWLQTQPYDVQQRALESTDALDCIAVLDAYKSSKKDVAQVVTKRKERLAASVTAPGGGRPVQAKGIDDMTPEEYRAHVAKQIWSN